MTSHNDRHADCHRHTPGEAESVQGRALQGAAHLNALLGSQVGYDALEGRVPLPRIVSIVECQRGLVSVLDDVAPILKLEGPLHKARCR